MAFAQAVRAKADRKPLMRFNLNRMLIVIAVLGFLLAVGTQFGRGTAQFKVIENKLVSSSNDLVNGRLVCSYVGTESQTETPWPIEIEIQRHPNLDLVKIKTGQTIDVRYRMIELGPLKKQDAFEIFLNRLGVKSNEVMGHVITGEHTKVIVMGQFED